jgi:hypothetical protein
MYLLSLMKIAYGFFPSFHFSLSHRPTQSVMQTNSFFLILEQKLALSNVY